MRFRILPALALLLVSCSESIPPTGVVVFVTAGPGIAADTESLVFRVFGAAGGTNTGGDVITVQRVVPLGAGQTLPFSLGIGPSHDDATRVYRVEVDALDSAAHVIASAKVISGYLSRRVLRVDLVLEDACRGVTCSQATETCRAAVCVDAHVDTGMLTNYDATMTGADATVDCPAGFSLVAGVCTPCAPGTFSTTVNATACTPWTVCTAGTYTVSTGSTTEDPCPTCPFGFWDDDASTTTPCVAWADCVPGDAVATQGTPTSNRTCSQCPAGTFSDTVSATACTPCAPGSWSFWSWTGGPTACSSARSFITPDAGHTTGAHPRSVTYQIDTPIAATIFYTTDGTVPGVSGTTQSGPAPISVLLADGMTVRWYPDFGGGATEPEQSYTHSTTTSQDFGIVVEGLDMNGGGPVITVAPGAAITGTFDVQIWKSSPTGYCPGCALVFMLTADNAVANCIGGTGSAYPGTTYTARTLSFTAPTTPGIYPISGHWHLESVCRAAPAGIVAGVLYVE